MSNLSQRDRTIAAVIVMTVLYAAAAAFWFLGAQNNWTLARKRYEREKTKRIAEVKLIGQRQEWEDMYEAERAKMPVFSEDDQNVDTHWQDRMNEIAQTNHIHISRWQPGKQEEAGDLFELPLTIPDWEGSLDYLLKFMYDLETADRAMFDIRQIDISPLQKNRGCLKGKFTLACAYMRGEKEEE